MKKSIFIKYLVAATFVFGSVMCQAQDGPPPMAMPTNDNKTLIDELIKVTNYETYFHNYCFKKINEQAEEQKWTAKKKEEIIKSIDFKYFNSTIYNQFAFHSTEELKQMIALFKELNKNKVQKLVLTSAMVEGNLEHFAKAVAEGKYVM